MVFFYRHTIRYSRVVTNDTPIKLLLKYFEVLYAVLRVLRTVSTFSCRDVCR
jgi:hypothetical protein